MPWSLGLALPSRGNKIEDVKSKTALVLALAVAAGTTQPSAAQIHIYDYSAAATANKGTELMKKGDYEAARQYYDAASGTTRNGPSISIAVCCSHGSESGN